MQYIGVKKFLEPGLAIENFIAQVSIRSLHKNLVSEFPRLLPVIVQTLAEESVPVFTNTKQSKDVVHCWPVKHF